MLSGTSDYVHGHCAAASGGVPSAFRKTGIHAEPSCAGADRGSFVYHKF